MLCAFCMTSFSLTSSAEAPFQQPPNFHCSFVFVYRVMSLIQISSMPVAVCTGMGPNLDAANNEASKSALLYLKMMTKKKALTEKEQANSAPPAGGNENKSNGRKKK